ncbi:hypothetical protein PVC01_000090700 [Plasmodium vivax]|uniref:VIR protein n=1 Tax=Plasmodium vivax TaxID=5855 RepID=A0A1G4E5K6_PLAVI|nr:hypothetical protein PVC01_000090700 [Plasmodium vivax]
MQAAITLSDLPSRKFDDLKKRINYNRLLSYQKPEQIENVRIWISDFLIEIDRYFSKKPVNELIKNHKDCIDFNYIINEITQKIYSLFNFMEGYTLTEKIKKWHEQFFTTNHDLPCKQVNKYFRHELKELYDLCEDRNFIIPNQANIINTPDCQEIISNMNNRKNTLINERDMLKRQYRSNFIRGISCDLSILDNQFPSITCSSFDEPALKTEEDSAEIYPANTEVSGEETETVSTSSSGKLMVETNGQLSMTGEGESGSGTPSNTLNLFALPILGVLGCSFLLYKFTPVGSLFRPRIKNKGIIPINKDDYAAKQLLSNIPNINDTYSENTQYKISYQTL